MEALAFGVESTLRYHSKFQCAGQSERTWFVSEVVAGVESGARQPIQPCNNRALTQGHTINTNCKTQNLGKPNTNRKTQNLGAIKTDEIANVSQLA